MEYITIDKPAQVNSKRVEAEIKELAQAGVRSIDIGLHLDFFTVDSAELFDKFKVLKNKVFLALDTRFND